MPEIGNTASRGKVGETGFATERLTMTRKHDYLIGRDWQKSSRTMPVTNPYTQEVVAEVCMADTAAILQALEFAERFCVVEKRAILFDRNTDRPGAASGGSTAAA